MPRRFDETDKGDGETGHKDNPEKDCEKLEAQMVNV